MWDDEEKSDRIFGGCSFVLLLARDMETNMRATAKQSDMKEDGKQ